MFGRYTPIKKIGEGAFGIVVAATDDATGVSSGGEDEVVGIHAVSGPA